MVYAMSRTGICEIMNFMSKLRLLHGYCVDTCPLSRYCVDRVLTEQLKDSLKLFNFTWRFYHFHHVSMYQSLAANIWQSSETVCWWVIVLLNSRHRTMTITHCSSMLNMPLELMLFEFPNHPFQCFYNPETCTLM